MARFKPTRFMAEDSKYNKKTADYAVSFIECLSHTKGTWAGKKFELLDWQEQKKQCITKMKSELINNLNSIKVANQNSYQFEEN